MKRFVSAILIAFLVMNIGVPNILAADSSGKISTKVFKGFFKNADYSNPKVYLQTGEQTKATPAIKELAKKVTANKNDLEVVKDIYHVIRNAAKLVDEGEKYSFTADQILKRGYTGCTDYGLVYAAVARELGIPTVFVQTARVDWIDDNVKQNSNRNSIRGHIFVEVYINNKWYLVDSTNGKLFLGYNKDNPALPDGYYVFAKSIEVSDSGIKNEQHNFQTMQELFSRFDINEYINKAQLLDYYDLFKDVKTINKSKKFIWEKNKAPLKGFFVVGQQKPVEYVQNIINFDKGLSLSVLFDYNDYDYKNSKLLILLGGKPADKYANSLNDLTPKFKDMKFGDTVVTTTKYNQTIGILYGKDESQLMDMVKKFDSEAFAENTPSANQSSGNSEVPNGTTNYQLTEINELKSEVEGLKLQIKTLKEMLEALMAEVKVLKGK